MGQILEERVIANNLKKVVEQLGGRDEAADLLGVGRNSLSNYMNLSGNKTPSRIVAKIIAAGFNGTWYLTGEGPMLIKDIAETDQETRDYAQIGRMFCDVLKKAAALIQREAIENEALMSGLLAKVNAINVPGPAPDLTEDEIEELSRRQGGHKTGCDEE